MGAWLIDLLGLPAAASFGLVTGCQMADFTGLAAARHAVLEARRLGRRGEGPDRGAARSTWSSAPRRTRPSTARCSSSASAATGSTRRPPTARAGCGSTPSRRRSTRIPAGRPLIVCLQAGNVNTGAFDPFGPMIDLVRRRTGAWVHVDGAFGLWARVSPQTAYLLDGAERADSWATDAHKWLNVPYDSGLAFVAHPRAHAAAMAPPLPPTSNTWATSSATRSTGTRSSRAAPAASRCTRRCAASGGPACARWSSAAAGSPAGSPIGSRPPPAPRSSTTSSSTRSSSASRPTTATRPPRTRSPGPPSRRSRRRAPSGCPGRPGTRWPPSGSRSRTGGPGRTKPSWRPRRSSAAADRVRARGTPGV